MIHPSLDHCKELVWRINGIVSLTHHNLAALVQLHIEFGGLIKYLDTFITAAMGTIMLFQKTLLLAWFNLFIIEMKSRSNVIP